MTTALVTGVTGQDGSYLAELLVREGRHVVGIARSLPERPVPPEIELVPGDVETADFIAQIVRDRRPTEIYHLAGQSSVGVP